MLDEILALNRQAAEQGNFEAAYHLLVAALHHADHIGDEAVLARLAEIGKQQGAAVEAVQPPHRLSRRLAVTRGQTALFDSFQAHLEAVRLRLQSARQQRQRPS